MIKHTNQKPFELVELGVTCIIMPKLGKIYAHFERKVPAKGRTGNWLRHFIISYIEKNVRPFSKDPKVYFVQEFPNFVREFTKFRPDMEVKFTIPFKWYKKEAIQKLSLSK